MRVLLWFIFSFVASLKGQTTILSCNFDKDDCTFSNDLQNDLQWKRQTGETPSKDTGPDQDHTSGSGYYLYMESNRASTGDISRALSNVMPGTGGNCATIQFYYHMFGNDIGSLSVYLVNDLLPYHYDNPLWSLDGNQANQWFKAELNVSYPDDFKVVFEGIAKRSLTDNEGDIAIDDILVETGKCQYTLCDTTTPWCENGGTCVEETTGSEITTHICECSPGWEGTHCESDVDECAINPCQNGGTCTHGVNSYECFCAIGYHGDNCEFTDQCVSPDLHRCENGGTCNSIENEFNCTCVSGYTGKVCETEVNECDPNPCQHGICTDLFNTYSCECDPDWVGFSCEIFSGGCDFDDGYEKCAYSTTPVLDFKWVIYQGPTPSFGTGPDGDHTTGEGFYMYTNADGHSNPDRARLYSPIITSNSVGVCSEVRFWYWMSGNTVGTLNVYVSGTGNNDLETNPYFTIAGDQGESWIEGVLEVSSMVSYSIIFEVVAKSSLTYRGDVAIDDVTIHPDACVYKRCPNLPCKNGGTCFEAPDGEFTCSCTDNWSGSTCEEDANQCLSNPCQNGGTCLDGYQSFHCQCESLHVGRFCEYSIGSCDFEDDDDPICSYQDDVTGNFTWKRWSGKTPSAQTGPNSDHTTGNLGYYIYAEASERVAEEKARIKTPFISGRMNSCTQLSFWYYMNGASVGQLALHLEFPSNPLASPIWTKVGGDRNGWTNVMINISVPMEFQIIFEAVMESKSLIDTDNRGDIAIDDVEAVPDVCYYEVCYLQPCKNGATCVAEGVSSYKCICDSHHSGNNCELFNQCESKPCANNGICEPGADGNFECLCTEEWVGLRCEEVDHCFSYPCMNGATCTTDIDFQCACSEGYEGVTCSLNTDDCAINPCLNGGSCVDEVGDYSCQCVSDLVGKNCEEVPASCDFEGGLFCGWATDEKSDYSWFINSGLTNNFPLSGPTSDHTTGTKDGYYIYTPLYIENPLDGNLYRIRSQQIYPSAYVATNTFKIEFYYHMKGGGIGTLNVYVEESGKAAALIFSLEGAQGDEWKYSSTTRTIINDFAVVFEHKVRETLTYMGDLAIDDIKIKLIADSPTITTTLPAAITTTISKNPVTTVKSDKTTSSTGPTTSDATIPQDGTEADSQGGGTDGGVIAGAVIGALFGIVIITGLIYWFWMQPRKKQVEKKQVLTGLNPGLDNPSYTL